MLSAQRLWPAADRLQHRQERLGNLQLLVSPVERECSQKAGEVAVDSEPASSSGGLSGLMAAHLQPVQPAAGIAGQQQLLAGDQAQGVVSGIGHEDHAGGAIGAARIPQADGDVTRDAARARMRVTPHQACTFLMNEVVDQGLAIDLDTK